MSGVSGGARIGNRRNRCTTCNNWAQMVRRVSWKRMVEADPKAYEELRKRVEIELYPQVMEAFDARVPG